MALPKAVQAAHDRASELQQQLLQPDPNDPTPPQDPPPEPPAEPTSPPAAPPPAPPGPPAQPSENWEQKYRTLQGMYNRLNGEIEQRDSRLRDMEQQLRELSDRVQQGVKPPPAPPTLVTEADRKAFGDDLIDVMRKVVQEQLTPVLDRVGRLEPQVQNTVKTVTETQATTAQQLAANFRKGLKEKVDDWELLNHDVEFLAWLDQPNEETGMPRRVHFNYSVQQLDASAVANYFNRFKATRQPATPPPVPPVSPAPARTAATGVPATPDTSNFVRRSDIQEFYRQASIGRYRDKPQEYARLDALYSRAAAEGRVLDA